MSDPTTARYAVAGHPVAHSQSPFIHAEFARQTGEDLVYDRLLCPLDAFVPTVEAFAAAGGAGCNVTLPFKLEAFGRAVIKTPRAALAEACNTLRFDADGWTGDNTDGAGLVADLERNAGVVLAGARVLLIGAGGAAAGSLGPLLAAGPSLLVVVNRTAERALELVRRHASMRLPDTAFRASPLDNVGTGFDIVVNASSSSVGGAPPPVPVSALKPGTLALDMMYGPAAAPFVAWAEAHGATGRDGLGMLVEQAAEAFVFWRGVRPRTAGVLAALRAKLASA